MNTTEKVLAWSAALFGGYLLWPSSANAATTPLASGDDPYAVPNLPAPLTLHTAGTSTSTGTEYPLTYLPQHWTSGHACDFVKYVKGLLAGSGITGVPAQLLIAHMGRESGFGQAVIGNNFGNVKAYHADPWMRLTHDHLAYKVYPSARAGINAQIAMMRDSTRYGAAWRKLLAGDKTWYSALGIAGWFQYRTPGTGVIVNTTPANVGASQADYERTLATVVRCWT